MVLAGTNLNGAMQVAECIRAAVAALRLPHARRASSDLVTISIGVACALRRDDKTTQGPLSLVQAADRALYRAKREGRDRVVGAMLLGHGVNFA